VATQTSAKYQFYCSLLQNFEFKSVKLEDFVKDAPDYKATILASKISTYSNEHSIHISDLYVANCQGHKKAPKIIELTNINSVSERKCSWVIFFMAELSKMNLPMLTKAFRSSSGIPGKMKTFCENKTNDVPFESGNELTSQNEILSELFLIREHLLKRKGSLVQLNSNLKGVLQRH
jgi:hypothetical protein